MVRGGTNCRKILSSFQLQQNTVARIIRSDAINSCHWGFSIYDATHNNMHWAYHHKVVYHGTPSGRAFQQESATV
jgi:hypothetical protein